MSEDGYFLDMTVRGGHYFVVPESGSGKSALCLAFGRPELGRISEEGFLQKGVPEVLQGATANMLLHHPGHLCPWDARLIVTRDAAAKGLVACSEGRRWEREYQALDDKAPSDPKAAAKALKKRSKRERQALELQEMQVWFAPPGGVKGPKGHEQLGDAAYEGAIQGLDAGCASQLLAGAYQQWFAAAAAHRVGMGFNGLQDCFVVTFPELLPSLGRCKRTVFSINAAALSQFGDYNSPTEEPTPQNDIRTVAQGLLSKLAAAHLQEQPPQCQTPGHVDLDRAKQADGDWVACTHLLLMAKQGGAGLKALPAQVGAMTSELLHSLGLCGTSPADLHVQVAFQAQLDKLSTPQGQCSDLPRTTADLKLTLDPNKAKATWGPALAAALQQESKAYLAQGPAAGCVTLVLHSLQQVVDGAVLRMLGKGHTLRTITPTLISADGLQTCLKMGLAPGEGPASLHAWLHWALSQQGLLDGLLPLVLLPNAYTKALLLKRLLNNSEGPWRQLAALLGAGLAASPGSQPSALQMARHPFWDTLAAGDTCGGAVTGVDFQVLQHQLKREFDVLDIGFTGLVAGIQEAEARAAATHPMSAAVQAVLHQLEQPRHPCLPQLPIYGNDLRQAVRTLVGRMLPTYMPTGPGLLTPNNPAQATLRPVYEAASSAYGYVAQQLSADAGASPQALVDHVKHLVVLLLAGPEAAGGAANADTAGSTSSNTAQPGAAAGGGAPATTDSLPPLSLGPWAGGGARRAAGDQAGRGGGGKGASGGAGAAGANGASSSGGAGGAAGIKQQHQGPPVKKARTSTSPTRAWRWGSRVPDAAKVQGLGLNDQGEQGDEGMQ